MRGSGAEVSAAIWSSERRLTAGNGEGGRKEAELAASTTRPPDRRLRFRRPGDAPRSVRRAQIQPNAADRGEVSILVTEAAKLLLRGLAIVAFGRRWALVQQPFVRESLPQK